MGRAGFVTSALSPSYFLWGRRVTKCCVTSFFPSSAFSSLPPPPLLSPSSPGRQSMEEVSVSLESQVATLKEDKAKLLEDILEAERQVLMWEKKIALERETQAALDPTVRVCVHTCGHCMCGAWSLPHSTHHPANLPRAALFFLGLDSFGTLTSDSSVVVVWMFAAVVFWFDFCCGL